MTTIALLGATGQIAKGLAIALAADHRLALHARNRVAAKEFAATAGIAGPRLSIHGLDEPFADQTDAIVNALGPGDPRTIRASGTSIAQITETFDLRVLRHLERRPETAYVFLSTGAVYGPDYNDVERPRRLLELEAKALAAADHYPWAKLQAEARHRALSHLHIADVRIFGYFSRHIDCSGGYLMSGIARAVLDGHPFETDAADFTRDYIGPGDLTNLLLCLLKTGPANSVVEARSAASTTKFAILQAFAREFGLKYEISGGADRASTRPSPAGIPVRDSAAATGYVPRYTSEQTVVGEMRALLDGRATTSVSARSVPSPWAEPRAMS
jgi:nucleoside-diphosphate-sugar epimerase